MLLVRAPSLCRQTQALVALARRSYSSPPAPQAFLSSDAAHPGIAFLNLNRPASKNALSMNLLLGLREAAETVRNSSDTRVLILQSTTPSIFCAGADLKERRSMTPEQIATFLSTLRAALGDLEGLPVPTIAALDGPLAVKAAKRAIDDGYYLEIEEGLDLEHECYQSIMPSEDRLEGLKAFAEKRKPVYRGR
ncbi:enoyl-CoA hydratase [Pseudohyphozyma bogoriensis]|nr:enoyl-CoA hydratase [Pseudohyphozyma bogoriensis]